MGEGLKQIELTNYLHLLRGGYYEETYYGVIAKSAYKA